MLTSQDLKDGLDRRLREAKEAEEKNKTHPVMYFVSLSAWALLVTVMGCLSALITGVCLGVCWWSTVTVAKALGV